MFPQALRISTNKSRKGMNSFFILIFLLINYRVG
ncbi:hypothetical protein ACIQZD_11900 [Peribacillus sp. NPDC096447]